VREKRSKIERGEKGAKPKSTKPSPGTPASAAAAIAGGHCKRGAVSETFSCAANPIHRRSPGRDGG